MYFSWLFTTGQDLVKFKAMETFIFSIDTSKTACTLIGQIIKWIELTPSIYF